MSIARTRHGIRPVKSTNKYGRSNKRHFGRQNHRKKTSDQYEKKFKNVQLSQFSADKWIPCPSGYTRSQGWNALSKAWLGYKIANNPRNGETIQDKLFWAQMIQNIQTDLGLKRSSFPQLSLAGDYVFAYDLEKELELQTEHDEFWLKYKKRKAARIQEIVDASMLTKQEKEWVEEYAPQFTTEITHEKENGYVERVVMPNLFDLRRNYHI